MSVRGGRGAPRARNLATPRIVQFPGDPSGEAITQGVLAGITPSLAGRAGYVYLTEEGSLERAWHGYARNPQPQLEARVAPGGTPVVFRNGPNDLTSTPSAEGGQVVLDARYRALAARMMRSG